MSQMDALTQLNGLINLALTQNCRLQRRVSTLEAVDAVRCAGRTPRMPIEFRSQFGEDALLWDLFAGQLDGYFIEVGAFDGYNFSVSYAFECLGWTGLLVEAIPERHAQCAARRPHSRVVHAALGGRGSSGTTEFTVTSDEHGGMLSYLRQGTQHAERVRAIPKVTARVPLTTMDDLLADHKGDIDFAVIDVEGAETLVLDGFSLDRHQPKVLLIEDDAPPNESPVVKYMARTQYREVGCWAVNRIYARADLAPFYAQRLAM